jgi:hypothetical protein
MLSAILLIIIILSKMPSVVMLGKFMLSVIMLSVIMMSVIMLFHYSDCHCAMVLC